MTDKITHCSWNYCKSVKLISVGLTRVTASCSGWNTSTYVHYIQARYTGMPRKFMVYLMTHTMSHSVRRRREDIHEITRWEELISTLVTESETLNYQAGEQRHIKNISNIASAWQTNQPTNHSTKQPTSKPANQPTNQTTSQPTNQPTNQPANQPTSQPANQPTIQPANQSTSQPNIQPSNQPTSQPNIQSAN